MLIGDFQQFTVVDEAGRPRYDATWSIDNSSLGTLTTDSAPVLTALTSGQANLTATVQGVTAQMPVTISRSTRSPSTEVTRPGAT